MSNAVTAAHTAYMLDGNDGEWLERLTELMGPMLSRGRGLLGYRWRRSADGGVRVGELYVAGGKPGDEEMLRELIANLDTTRASLAYGAPYSFRSLSEIAQEHPTLSDLTDDRDMQRIAHDREVVDFEMLRVDESDGRGWMFTVLRTEVGGIVAPRRALWDRVRAHIAAGARLRMRLAKPDLDGAGAVYDPTSGRLDVNSSEMRTKARRRRLLELIEARRHAEELAEKNPLEAMDLWQGLVDGRWSLLDVVDTDGRAFTVLKENPLQVRSRAALSERERQVAFLVGRGHHVKLVAYELGLTASTVRSQLRSALRKLNLEDRSALCRLVADMSQAGAATRVEDVGVLALAKAPLKIPESLTDAEREVAQLVYKGLTNGDIARTRSTTTHTVANQLATIYRKLDISSRDELMQCLAGSGESFMS
ncbi:helix-turn-helix transcriptional regulator [Persicimonas caeni]|uniref:Helix-turn-helix transcriptional regulator n=1 Tax=Persicimonas caeni TaxID=2292766 RepID=A0A4Y6PMH2_PERCE|nr:helix-turn-helix transcriptional regulator [Persicimonas caeni]QDG49419.1 helix-turn-helix transcriptional regulator [Persicimonas caeni]QED30640.1 helix-turn-helix transcriptional regulator [Persicimonas caeni]